MLNVSKTSLRHILAARAKDHTRADCEKDRFGLCQAWVGIGVFDEAHPLSMRAVDGFGRANRSPTGPRHRGSRLDAKRRGCADFVARSCGAGRDCAGWIVVRRLSWDRRGSGPNRTGPSLTRPKCADPAKLGRSFEFQRTGVDICLCHSWGRRSRERDHRNNNQYDPHGQIGQNAQTQRQTAAIRTEPSKRAQMGHKGQRQTP